MRIKNISTQLIVFNDLFLPNSQHNIELKADEEIVIFNEDAEKSQSLLAFFNASMVSKLSNEEPSSSSPTADPSTDLEAWVLSNDLLIQFIDDAGELETASPAPYSATATIAKSVRLVMTDGDGTRDLLNSSSTFLVTADVGTVNGSSSDTVTFDKGLATISVLKGTSGVVTLTLSDITHPLSSAIPPTIVTAIGTAEVTFA